MNEPESGAQFAARQHLQTVKLQVTIIHGQQRELERARQRIGQLEEALRQATNSETKGFIDGK